MYVKKMKTIKAHLKKTTISIIIIIFLILNANSASATNNVLRLADCPGSSNCVRIDWGVDNVNKSFEHALNIIKKTERTKIIEEDDNYVHAEVTSKIMHFIDDLEVLKLLEDQKIEIRSSSRVGINDLGVNKNRVINLLNEMERQT